MEIPDKQNCELTIRRIHELLGSGIFERNNSGHILQQAAFIDLMTANLCLGQARAVPHATRA